MRHVSLGGLVLALAAFGCDDGDDDPGGGDAGVQTGALTVATFNAGIARGFVNHAGPRVQAVSTALSEIDVDVLCLQEVWDVPDRQAIEAGAGLEHTYNIPADAGECEGAACAPDDVNPLLMCYEPNCADAPPGTIVECANEHCPDQVNALPGPCIACIAGALTDEATIDDLIGACGPDSEAARGCYAYDGSFGTDIVSKYPLADTDALVFESSLNRRAVLYARATGTPQGDVHVFCTHLSAVFENIPHPGEADGGSWEAEQRAQIDAMRAWIDEKAGGGKVVVMGDFNTGPAVADRVLAEVPENYEALIEGYDPTYTAQDDADCTFCGDNALVTGVDRDKSVLLDHVLIRGFEGASTQGEIILDQQITLDIEGMSVPAALSDHYGVQVRIE